jgi:putative ABC transport system permease protein
LTALLWRAGGRHLLRHPGQIGLAITGVALGVAVAVSIDLANDSARRAFTLSTEAVTGRATHQVVAGPGRLADGLLPRLVLDLGVTAAPVVEDYVTALPAGRPGRALHLLGVDPFAETPFRGYLARRTAAGPPGAEATLTPLLTRPGACLLAEETVRALGLRPGARFRLRVGTEVREVELAGVLAPGSEGARLAVSDLLLMDISSAQEVLGRIGKLDRVDLLLPSEDRGLAARVAALLPPGAELLPAGARTRSALDMTRAFRVNLSALSLLALMCGLFLIYNTITFSVVQRRTLLGTLRALGVTRRQVFALVLGEAAAIGAAGTAAGLGSGVLLARGLVGLVTRTVNDLYFAVAVRQLAVPAATLAAGAALGIGATLLAALAPALEATLAPPRAVLSRAAIEARARRALPRASALGVGLLAAGAAVLALPAGSTAAAATPGHAWLEPAMGGGLVLSFAALFAIILGCALLAPAATVGLMRLLRRPMGALFGVLGRLAARGVTASLSRTGVAIAALVVAVSVTVGIGVMIASFRLTVVRWLEGSLRADVYVAAPARAGAPRGATLEPDLARRAAALPGVERVDVMRRVEVPAPGGPVRLLALGSDRRGFDAFELRQGDPRRAWEAFARGGVLVSEPFWRRTGIGAGGEVLLATSLGRRRLPVAGVFYDYASDRGVVLMSRATYLRLFGDPALSGFSLILAPGAGTAETIARLRRALGPERALAIESNRDLKRLSLEIFDRTFLITGVLRLLAGLVAAIGVLSALTALSLERARELGVLRASGMTPAQVWQLVMSQTGLMGLAAGLLSLPVGLALAAIMVYVVNLRSFGWTVRLAIAPGVLLEALLLALAAALVAGLYPAWRMARTRPAMALREE